MCRRVCKSWLENLTSDLSRKILPIPKDIFYSGSLDLEFIPKTIARTKSFIY